MTPTILRAGEPLVMAVEIELRSFLTTGEPLAGAAVDGLDFVRAVDGNPSPSPLALAELELGVTNDRRLGAEPLSGARVLRRAPLSTSLGFDARADTDGPMTRLVSVGTILVVTCLCKKVWLLGGAELGGGTSDRRL